MYLRQMSAAEWPSADDTTPDRADDTSVGACTSIPFDRTPRDDVTSFTGSEMDTDDEVEAVRRVSREFVTSVRRMDSQLIACVCRRCDSICRRKRVRMQPRSAGQVISSYFSKFSKHVS